MVTVIKNTNKKHCIWTCDFKLSWSIRGIFSDVNTFGAPEYFVEFMLFQSLVFCVVFCRSLFDLFSFSHWIACPSSIYRLQITPLESLNLFFTYIYCLFHQICRLHYKYWNEKDLHRRNIRCYSLVLMGKSVILNILFVPIDPLEYTSSLVILEFGYNE